MNDWRKWINVAVSVVSCAVIALLIDWREAADVWLRADPYWLCAGFVLIHLDRMFMAVKWKMLLRYSPVKVSQSTAIQAYYVSSFWSTFLPSSIGADAVRTVWLSKKGADGAVILSSIIVERVFGALALAVVAVAGVIVFSTQNKLDDPAMIITIIAFLSVTCIITAALFNRLLHVTGQRIIRKLPFPRLVGGLERTRAAVESYAGRPRLLTAFLILSVAEQAFPILGNYTMVKAFEIDLSMTWLIMGVPIILAVARMPISMHGFGVQEAAYAFVFGPAGVSVSTAVSMSVGGRILLLLSAIPGAFWTMRVKRGRPEVSGAPALGTPTQ